MKDVLDRHSVAVLQFSGGKDSLACLWLLEPYWSRITVAWVNTGDAFPETIAQMDGVRRMVPNFIEIASNARANHAQFGYPCDVLPVRNHPNVIPLQRDKPQPLQSYYECCNANLWQPMQAKMREIGATLLIRGQRCSDKQRGATKSGDVIDGFELLFPIEDWSAERVREYVKGKPGGLPDHYRYVDTSLDCQHCTAYLSENIGKRRYMAKYHPIAYGEVSRRLWFIQGEVAKGMRDLTEARAT